MTSILLALIGVLLGLLGGALVSIRYIRDEMTARVRPQLELLLTRQANLQGTVDLAIYSSQADRQERLLADNRQRASDQADSPRH
jgi:hypothetical protein